MTVSRYGAAGRFRLLASAKMLTSSASVIDLLNKMSAPGWFEKLTICGQVEDICSRLLRARDTLTDLVSRLNRHGGTSDCLEFRVLTWPCWSI